MSFDVLSKNLAINQHILCEASAGTGKTFTIEHLFIRRLITPTKEATYPTVKQIAVLTFTKAVARELVLRLKRALDQAIIALKTRSTHTFDYLLLVQEQGLTEQVIGKLEQAREEIDFSSIGTIHSFCYQTLTEFATSTSQVIENQWASSLQIKELLFDYFRDHPFDDPLTQRALKILLKKHAHDFGELIKAIMALLWSDQRNAIRSPAVLCQLIQELPKPSFSAENALAALERAADDYKGLRTRQGDLKDGLYDAFVAFAQLLQNTLSEKDFVDLIEHPLFASELFSEKKAKALSSEHPIVAYAFSVEARLYEFAHPDSLLKRLAQECREYVTLKLEEKGLFCQEVLLEQMEKAIETQAFKEYVQKRFACVIVDEFQDTDPRQWKIMSELFLSSWKGNLYLVGDPKQAIYSFRAADVYSYMQAKNLEDQLVATLTTNYRSSSALVSALNTLFVGPHTEKLFYLPKLQTSLEVPEVSSNAKVANLDGDNLGAIHFFTTSGTLGRKRQWPTDELEQELLAFTSQEIIKLCRLGIDLAQMVVLVSDRHQANRVQLALSQRKIPAICWRKKTVIDTEAHHFFKRLAKALLFAKDRSRLIELLMHAPFYYSSDDILRLHDLDFWASCVTFLFSLKEAFEKRGVRGLLSLLLATPDQRVNRPIKELCWENKEFLRDLDVLGTLSIGFDTSLQVFHEHLEGLSQLPEQEKEQFSTTFEPDEEAVQIMTIHASKGLEFDIVFALGLANRHPEPDAQKAIELDAEKLRQFYVGCTRAKRRLYLPVAKQEDLSLPKVGTSSPIELFLGCLSEGDPLEWLVARSNGTISKAKVINLPSQQVYQASKKPSLAPLCFSPLEFPRDKTFVTSYTKLKDLAVATRAGKQISLDNPIPNGIESGILLHALLTEAIQNGVCIDLLKERLKLTLFQGIEEEIEKLLKYALNAQLGDFSLRDVDLQKAFCEHEFYHYKGNDHYERGCIDLAFEHDGKSYLLDWKSNVLEDYSAPSLANEVKKQGYDLQAAIYTKAWTRYLASKESQFGGFFFVFLRGLNPDNSEGVLLYDC